MRYPIPPKHSFGKDDLAYWEGFFTSEDIDKILALPHWHQQKDGVVGGAISNTEAVNKNIRRSQVSWLGVSQETDWIWRNVTNAVSNVNRQFFHYDLTGCYEDMQLSIYSEEDQGCYNWHVDNSVNGNFVPRKLSMSLLLSDPSEFEGGELQVKHANDEPKTLQAKKGRAWFFPSYMLHRVTPVTKGVRRSIVLWVGGPEFK